MHILICLLKNHKFVSANQQFCQFHRITNYFLELFQVGSVNLRHIGKNIGNSNEIDYLISSH